MINTPLYDVKCKVDVATLTHNPQAAYEFFKEHWTDQFQTYDRIILYTAHPWPSKLIKHLYEATLLVDISNCFVLLAGPTIENQHVIQLSNTDTSFETLVTDFVDETMPLGDSYTLGQWVCSMPWMHLEVRNQGQIHACCVSKKSFGNVNEISLQEAFDGEDMKNFRQQFLNNTRPVECSACWKLEEQKITSIRTRHLKLWKKDFLTEYLSNPEIVSLDLKPGNTCNFKCRICNPEYSSLFAQEQSAYDGIPVKSYNWAESSTVTVDQIKKLFANIKNLDMYGGEPFLIKPLTSLIEHAVDTGVASQMRLHYNSNGSIYPTHLLKYWTHFKHVDIHFSIDDVGPRFELERGGKWEDVERNITQLVQLRLPNVKISIWPVISIMNIYYLDELLFWCKKLGLSVNAGYVSNPSAFALSNLTQEAKDLIIDKFSNSDWPEIQQILTTIKQQPASNGKEFAKLTKHFDQLRGQDFCNTHKEFAIAMKMC
jgi:MoaA/NifB/PqqE/SkfB family radical SAM enzyme